MAGQRRCELPTAVASWGDAFSVAFARTNERTTPVSQATSSPDSELTRLRQADEGRVPPTAGGRWRESSPTASRHYLRNTRTRTCRRERAAGPGVRLATSPTTGTATETRSGRRNTHTHAHTHTLTHTHTHTHTHMHTHQYKCLQRRNTHSKYIQAHTASRDRHRYMKTDGSYRY